MLGADEATTERALARALALGGWALDRERGARAARGRRRARPRPRRCSPALPDPNALPGPLRVAGGARRARRARGLQRQLARGLGRVPVPVVRRATSSRRSASSPRPTRSGSAAIVHGALERLYREPPGEDSIPRPGDVGRWQRALRRAARASGDGARGRAAQPRAGARRSTAPGSRSRPSSTPRRRPRPSSGPRPGLLELGFGPFDEDADGERADARGAARSASVALRGRIDRIDVAPDGRSAIVRDYKTGKSVPRRGRVRRARASCRSSSTCGSPQRVLGLDPVAGLYQPLGAADPRKRKPRGDRVASDERLDGLEHRRHRPPRRRGVRARRSTRPRRPRSSAAARDARRADRPRPDRRPVPEVLHLPADLPARARARRGRRAERQRRGASDAPIAGPALARRARRRREPAPPTRPRPSRRRPTGRSSRPPSSGGDRGARAATPSSRRAPAPARRRSWSTATARRSTRTGSRSSGSSPSPSPSAPPPRCASRVRRELLARRARRPRGGRRAARRPSCSGAARATERAWVMTIHAFCRRLLAAHPLAAGLDPRFRVLDAAEATPAARPSRQRGARRAARRRRRATSRRAAAAYQPWRLTTMAIERARAPAQPGDGRAAAAGGRATRCTRREPDEEQRALTPGGARGGALGARAALERLLEGFHRRYEQLKEERSALDFQDLELRALALLRSSPALAASLARALRARDGRRVPGHEPGPARADRGAARAARHASFMVGDENQSIYRFRNADLEVFRERARGGARRRADCEVLPLRGNFRSLPACSAAVNEVGRTLLDDFAELTAGRARDRTGRARSSCCSPSTRAAAADARMGRRRDRARAAAERLGAADRRRGALPRPAPARAGRRRARPSAARSSSCCAPSPTSTPTRRRCARAGLRPFVVGGRGYWTQQQVEDLARLLGVVANPLDDERLFGALASFAAARQPRRPLAAAPARATAEGGHARHVWPVLDWRYGDGARAADAARPSGSTRSRPRTPRGSSASARSSPACAPRRRC